MPPALCTGEGDRSSRPALATGFEANPSALHPLIKGEGEREREREKRKKKRKRNGRVGEKKGRRGRE